MISKRHPDGLMRARQSELGEARFYYAVLMPVCLVASVVSAVGSVFVKGEGRGPVNGGVWSRARAQANTIIPFIMMK